MPILSQEVNELFGLLDKAIALASEAISAPTERPVEIRAELERIVRAIDKIKASYKTLKRNVVAIQESRPREARPACYCNARCPRC